MLKMLHLNILIHKAVLSKFKNNQVINIEKYTEILNRNQQDFKLQKLSPKLILAVKKDGFIYKGSDVLPSFGHNHFYYNSVIQNCIYDCDYCYLQGMYNSANIVVFVKPPRLY